MTIEWLGPASWNNYTVGREGNPITLVVDHWMGTRDLAPGDLFLSALYRFRSDAAIVSAHYLIGQDGRIGQVVKDEDAAYHSGWWQTNLNSIGIEHEASPTMLPTDALYASSAWLHAQLSARYKIALAVGQTVLPHNAVIPTQCPGTLDLNRIVEEAMAVSQEDFTAYKADVRATFEAIKEVLASLASGQARDDTRDAALAQQIKDTEYKAIVTALLDVRPEALKPRP